MPDGTGLGVRRPAGRRLPAVGRQRRAHADREVMVAYRVPEGEVELDEVTDGHRL